MILTRFKLGDNVTVKTSHKVNEHLYRKTLMFRYNIKEDKVYLESLDKPTNTLETLYSGPLNMEMKSSIIIMSIKQSSTQYASMDAVDFALTLNDLYILNEGYRERVLAYADKVIDMLTNDTRKEMEVNLIDTE